MARLPRGRRRHCSLPRGVAALASVYPHDNPTTVGQRLKLLLYVDAASYSAVEVISQGSVNSLEYLEGLLSQSNFTPMHAKTSATL